MTDPQISTHNLDLTIPDHNVIFEMLHAVKQTNKQTGGRSSTKFCMFATEEDKFSNFEPLAQASLL